MKELKRIVKGLAILIGLASVMYALMLVCVHLPYLLFVVFLAVIGVVIYWSIELIGHIVGFIKVKEYHYHEPESKPSKQTVEKIEIHLHQHNYYYSSDKSTD